MSLTRAASLRATGRAATVVASVLLALAAAVLLAAQAGILDGLAVWIQIVQRDLHRELAAAVRAVQAEAPLAGWSLVAISFLYGVFHAAGPGHGKVVIATYLATHPQSLSRGILLSTLSALAQGVTAIVAVGVTVLLIGAAARATSTLAADLEFVSYVLVTLLGAALVLRSARRLWSGLHVTGAAHGHDGAHDHQNGHQHEHHHGHAHGDHCGHNHGPTAADLEGRPSLLGMAGVVLSVGIRPCSGAILVLVLAHIVGIVWAGILAVLAMSLGTAITVSALATLAVHARGLATRLSAALSEGGRPGVGGLLAHGLAFAGGVVILTVGGLLLQSAWVTTSHPLL